ncbi:MAG: hypothetical protein AABY11_02785 [archaeon]
MSARNTSHYSKGSFAYLGGIFLTVSGVGGLLSVWAAQSVFQASFPWIGSVVLILLLTAGFSLFTHAHPSRKRAKAFA